MQTLITFTDSHLLEYTTKRVKEQGGKISQFQLFFFCKLYRLFEKKACFSAEEGTFFVTCSLNDFASEFKVSVLSVQSCFKVLEKYGLISRVSARSSDTYNKYHYITYISNEFIRC